MYYNLTKEKYKKYEAEFKKTYVGSQCYKSMVSLYFGFIFLLLLIMFDYFLDSIDKVKFALDVFSICDFIVLFIVGIASFFQYLEYKREVKDYILNKNTK